MTERVSYPCPLCTATATLDGPCPGCGRDPDPDAAAVLAHDARIAELMPQVAQARVAYDALAAQLTQTRQEREAYASRVRAAVARERATRRPVRQTVPPTTGPSTAAPAWPTVGAGHAAATPGRGPESSPRTVQNLLFVLGGLLLGIAAIVFTAVAWAAFDVVGRALILGVLTVALLAVPPLVRRRALTGTAETFAALGLLLVVLDGYAIWYVNLGGVADTWDGSFYAGVVATVTALLGYGYARLVGTAATRFGALLAAQPVLPLFFLESSAGVAGWSLIFSAVALGDLLHYRTVARPAEDPDAIAPITFAPDPAAPDPAAPDPAALDPAALDPAAPGDAVAAAPAATPAGSTATPVATGSVPAASESSPSAATAATASAAGAVTGGAEPGAAGQPSGEHAAALPGRRVTGTPTPSTAASAGVPGRAGLAVLTVLAYLGMLGTGLLLALIAWVLGAEPDTAVDGSLALLAAAGVLSAGLWRAGRGDASWIALRTAGGVMTAALAAALARPALVQWPHQWLLVLSGVAAVVTVLWVAVRGPLSARRPELAQGMAGGAALALTVPAVCAAGWALGAGAQSIENALPWWAADPPPFDGTYGWLLPVSLALVAVTGWVLAGPPAPPATRSYVAAAAIFLLPMTLPGHPPLAPWAAVACELAAAALALAIALLTRRHAVLWGVVAGLSAALALLAGAGTRTLSAVALSGVVLLGLGAAAAAWRRDEAPTDEAPAPGGVSPLRGVRALGGVAGAVALALAPAAVHSVAAAAGVDDLWARRAMLAAALLTPLWVYLAPLRMRPYAVAGGLLGALWALPGFGTEVPQVYAALCTLALALVGVQARRAWAEAPAQAVLALTLLLCGEALHRIFIAPLSWLQHVWAGDPVGTGLTAYPAEPVGWPPAIALLLVAPAVGLWFWRGGRRLAVAAGGLTAAVAALVALAAAQAPWPTVSAVQLVLGVSLLVLVELRPRNPLTIPGGLYAVLLTGVGLCGALAEKWSTIAGLALVTVALGAVAVGGRSRTSRTAGWLAGAGAKVLLAYAVGAAAELPTEQIGYLVLGVAAIILGLAYAPFAREQRPEAEAAAHSAALVALTLCHGELRPSALVLALWGIAVGLTVLRAPRAERVLRAAAAALAEAAAWCVVLAANGVVVIEAYTLPVAVLALGAGWYAARNRPELSSWLFAGPALVAALLPSLAAALTEDAGTPLRRLLLGAGALAVTVFGAVRRLQAPVLLGGGTLLVLALHELVLVADLLPTWVPIAVGGAVLLGLAITYERSRRDVARLRGAIGRMR